jgi:imidazolonepropionase-like amidohydrolase
MMRVRLAVSALLLAAAPALAAAQTIAITGGTVFPVRGPRIEHGTVLIRDGRIVAVGAEVVIPAGATRIDATGKWVTPGLVDLNTELGLVEVGGGGGANEASAKGLDAVAASFRPWVALNPGSVLIPAARAGGVTTAAVWPTGGLVAGQGALIDLVTGSMTDMLLAAPIGMAAQVSSDNAAGVGARGELFGRLRDLLDNARAYGRRKADYERGQMRPVPYRREDLEALLPVVSGTLALVIAADRAADIEAALALAADLGLHLVIAGGAEAWQVADQLAAARVPVLTGAMNNIPQSFNALGSRQENAALLRKAGVTVALIGNGAGDEELFNVRNLRFEAGNAVAYGMGWDDALRSVTLAPAEVFGVSDRVGALAPGLEGNVVIWSGDPFEFATTVEHVLVRGHEYTAPSRQDLLIQRYRTLPPQRREP